MAVEVGCAECGKKYRVDDKFIGKKIRCKNCQAVMRIEGEAAPVVAGSAATPEKPRVKSAAPVARKRPSSSAPRSSAPQPEALDLPDLSGLDVPSGPTIQLEEQELAPRGAADPACPSCGNPFPAANRVCMNCGYNRASGQRAKTQVEKASLGYASRTPDRDSSGTRVWREYENPVLNFLDNSIPRIAMVLFFGMGAAMVVAPVAAVAIMGGPVSPGLLILLFLLVVLYLGLFWRVTLKITMYGVQLAAKIFKFEVPEDGRARLLGMVMVATVVTVPIVLVGILAAGAGHPGASMGVVAGTLILGFVTFLAVSFACFALLFHMRIIEAIPGYFLMILFYFLGSLASSAVSSTVGAVLKGVLPWMMGAR
jgi:hypothetical protein